jgi:hypothetical protein
VSSTLLQLVQQARSEMGLSSPTSVIGNQADDVVQTLALINAVGNELRTQYDWQKITKEYRFLTEFLTTTGTWTTSADTVTAIPTTAALAANLWMAIGNGINQDTYIESVDSGTQVTLTVTPTAAGTAAAISFCKTKYAMPSDFDRLVDRTEWDKSRHWENLGPETGQQWQWLKSGFIASGPRVRFRPLGGYFQIWPPLAEADLMGFEYVSEWWVSATGAPLAPSKTAFTVDTDTCVFPDRLMILGLKKKYFEIKGFDTSAFERDYSMQLNIAKANDAGSKTLSMSPSWSQQLITEANIPDSFPT